MKRTITLAALFAAGCAAALTLGTTVASAWDWTSLPNGYGVSDLSLGNGCHDITISGNHIGSSCDQGFQAALDAYVNSTICTVNPAAGGSACAPTTTTAATQPTSPATTTPAATVTAPTSAETSPAATTPATQPAPTTTETATVTAAISADVAALTDRIAALERQIAALSALVDRVALAGDAAWLAFQKAVAGGADTATAADLARGTYLNAEYGLGEFAP